MVTMLEMKHLEASTGFVHEVQSCSELNVSHIYGFMKLKLPPGKIIQNSSSQAHDNTGRI